MSESVLIISTKDVMFFTGICLISLAGNQKNKLHTDYIL